MYRNFVLCWIFLKFWSSQVPNFSNLPKVHEITIKFGVHILSKCEKSYFVTIILRNFKLSWTWRLRKQKDFQGKQTTTTISLHLIANIKHENQIQNMIYVIKKYQIKNYSNTISINMNMKWNEQGHGSRSYLKPMLNRQKIMKGLTFIYAILETKLEKINPWKLSYAHYLRNLFEILLNYKWIMNQLN